MHLYGLFTPLMKIIYFIVVGVNCTKRQATFFSDGHGKRLILVNFRQATNSTDLNDIAESMESCSLFNRQSFRSTHHSEVLVSSTKLTRLIDICSVREGNILTSKRVKLSWTDGAIVPGTKWCGDGDIAEDYEDLGLFATTDRCCRQHDHCEKSLEPGGSIDFAENKSPFYIIHCECDIKFKACLKEGNNIWSDLIGIGYFDLLTRPCLALDQLQECCLRMRHMSHHCLEYRLLDSLEYWQLWDPSPYLPDSGRKAVGANSCGWDDYLRVKYQ